MSRIDIDRMFRRKRLWQVLLLLLVGCVILFGLLPLLPRGEQLLRRAKLTFVTREIGLAISGGAAFLYLLFSFINWRCPACRKLLWFGLFAAKCKGCDANFAKGASQGDDASNVAETEHENAAAGAGAGVATVGKAIETQQDSRPVEAGSQADPVDGPLSEPVMAVTPRSAMATQSEPLPPVEQSVPFERRHKSSKGVSSTSNQGESSDEAETTFHEADKMVRCKACPRCGSASYRKKRPDKVMPIFRIRECRSCNQQYKGPSSKKICLVIVLVGVGAMLPWLLAFKNYSEPMQWLKGTWPLAIPGVLGFVILLVGLKKMFLQGQVEPPEREHGRRRGDIRKAYETDNLLLNVSPNPVAVDKPLEAPQKKVTRASTETKRRKIATQTVGTQKTKDRVAVTSTPSRASAEQVAESEAPVATPAPVLNTEHSADSGSRRLLRAGCVIPAHPLALNAARQLDERRMRALTRYYLDAGAGGVAIGVHTTQFAIREQPMNMFRHVLEQTMGELFDYEMTTQKSLVKVVGICGETKQAINEAELGASLGYDVGLLNLGLMRQASNEQLLWHCREVAKAIPVFGFYLAPAVGGRVLDYDFWRKFAEIENVVAIKIAAFNRYDTINVIRAVANAGRAIQLGQDNPEGIALYTGNDDHIVGDLLGEWSYNVDGKDITQRIVGGLLGHWAVWTKAAVDTFESIRKVNQSGQLPLLSTTLARQVTDMNAAIFDAANKFAGCVPGIHEVLRRQGLLEGTYCLNHTEKLSPGQAEEITRVIEAYPHLTDDEFVAENRDKWLR